MNVTSSTQTQYTSNTNRVNQSKETQKEYESKNSPLIDEKISYRDSKKDAVTNDFMGDSYSKESTNFKSSLIRDEIKNRVDAYAQKMMDERVNTSKSDLQNSKQLNEYKNELLQEYKASIENSTDGVLNAEHVAIIKALMEENSKEASSLEKLLAQTTTASSSTNIAKTESTDPKMAEMQEKYKDVYTPIPETYSKADEDLQAQKISEAYPNYPFGSAFLEFVNSFYEGEPIIPGNGITQEQKEQQEVAFQKAYDLFGGEDAYKKMQKDVQAIKEQYPINEWAKQGYADNSRELARFKNAAIYEGLELGLSLESATKVARNAEYMFMDTSYASKMLDDKLIKAGLMSLAPEGGRETVKTEVNFDHPYNGTMDLRAYGIEGAWNTNEVIENQKGMLQEIEKKLSQFNFMLNNKELIKEAIMKLPADARGVMNNEGYESWINKELLPRMQLGYEVFSKYQIYDN